MDGTDHQLATLQLVRMVPLLPVSTPMAPILTMAATKSVWNESGLLVYPTTCAAVVGSARSAWSELSRPRLATTLA
uniref:Uncharacterized protein n=1 Tax=Arundo donax TaxID=35708 RepID=A0A0A9UCD5_ARUDO